MVPPHSRAVVSVGERQPGFRTGWRAERGRGKTVCWLISRATLHSFELSFRVSVCAWKTPREFWLRIVTVSRTGAGRAWVNVPFAREFLVSVQAFVLRLELMLVG